MGILQEYFTLGILQMNSFLLPTKVLLTIEIPKGLKPILGFPASKIANRLRIFSVGLSYAIGEVAGFDQIQSWHSDKFSFCFSCRQNVPLVYV